MKAENVASPEYLTNLGSDLNVKLKELETQGLELVILSTPRVGTKSVLAVDAFRGRIIHYDETHEILHVKGYSQEYLIGTTRALPSIQRGEVPSAFGNQIEREIPVLAGPDRAIYTIMTFNPFEWVYHCKDVKQAFEKKQNSP